MAKNDRKIFIATGYGVEDKLTDFTTKTIIDDIITPEFKKGSYYTGLNKGTDAIFQVNDPVPFLTVHHWQIPLLLLNNLAKLKGWIRIDFNIGKLVELGGD